MACPPPGAEAIPGLTAGTLILSLAEEGLGDLAGMIGGIWGEIAVQPIIARMSVQNLCDLNPSDPGPPTANDLQVLANYLTPWGANPLDSNGAPNWYIRQVYYQYFTVACRCIDATPIPPRQQVSMPPGEPTFPTDTASQNQLTRIERGLQTSSDALTTLYNGVQVGFADVRDFTFRNRQHVIRHYGAPLAAMSGEGVVALPPTGFGESTVTQDTLGVIVQLTAIPPTVKRRGTLYQRLYGVGSLEWSAESSPGAPHTIAQRNALHYEREFVVAPQLAQVWNVRWRLQPGVRGDVYWVERSSDSALYQGLQPYNNAYYRYEGWPPPPGFTDPPFYPKAAASDTRVWALKPG